MKLRKIEHLEELQNMWIWAAPWIEKAVGEEGGWYELDVIKSWLEQGALQLWIADDGPGVPVAFLVTEVIREGNDKVLQLRWCGGRNIESWVHLLKGVEEVAKWNSVAKVEVIGRKGWERQLREYGYEFKHVVLGKRLDYSRTLN